jgi:hypothetical protein
MNNFVHQAVGLKFEIAVCSSHGSVSVSKNQNYKDLGLHAIIKVMATPPDRRPRDPNQLGKLMVDIASGEIQDTISHAKKNPTRKGRVGGLKGGRARAESLTDAERSAISRKAADSRWHRKA